MRSIKFRAWDKLTNSMFLVVGLFFDSEDEGEQVELVRVRSKWFESSDPTDATWRSLDEVELMQFTSLKDKNGREIYEEDIILNHNYDTKGEVRWVDGNAEYICYHASGWFKFTDEYEVEIIGNIYENPELLGGKKCSNYKD